MVVCCKVMDEEYGYWEGYFWELCEMIKLMCGCFDGDDKCSNFLINKWIFDNMVQMVFCMFCVGLMLGIILFLWLWFCFGLCGFIVDEMDFQIKEYLYEVQCCMYEVMCGLNIYCIFDCIYDDFGMFGMFVLMVLDDFEDVICGYFMQVGSYWLVDDGMGWIVVMYCEIKMLICSIVEMFGLDCVLSEIKWVWDKQNYYEIWMICYVVEKCSSGDFKVLDVVCCLWVFCYWEKVS